MKNYLRNYEHQKRIMKELERELPDAMEGFNKIQRINAREGVLSVKTKELMAIAISISMHSKGCIVNHVKEALEAGASRQEIIETIGIAILLGGSPVVMSACKAFEALKEFMKERSPALLYG
jgi:AhpD family alkylhydroperoxidase